MDEKLEQIRSFIQSGLEVTGQAKEYTAIYDVEEDFVGICVDGDMPVVTVYPRNLTRKSIVGDKQIPGFSIWILAYRPGTWAYPGEYDEKFVDETTMPVEAAEMAVMAFLQEIVRAAIGIHYTP